MRKGRNLISHLLHYNIENIWFSRKTSKHGKEKTNDGPLKINLIETIPEEKTH